MADIQWHKAVASGISAAGKRKDAFKKINELNSQGADDATITEAVKKLGGNYQQTLKASNPDAAASAAVKDISGGASVAVLPDNYNSSLEAINTIDSFVGHVADLNSIKKHDDTTATKTVVQSLNALDDRLGATSTLTTYDTNNTAHTRADVATHLAILVDLLGNVGAFTLHDTNDVEVLNSSVTTLLTKLAALVGRAGGNVMYDVTDTEVNFASVATQLAKFAELLGRTGASSTTDVNNVVYTNVDVKTHLANIDQRMGATGGNTMHDINDASVVHADVATHLSKIDEKVGRTGGLSITDVNNAAHTHADVASHLTNIDGRIGATGGLSIKDVGGTAHTHASVLTHLNSLDRRLGDNTTLMTSDKDIVSAINDLIKTINALTGINLDTTINSAFQNIDNTIGTKPLITSNTFEHSLSGGINALKLEAGTSSLSSNFAKDDVNSFVNMANLLKTILTSNSNSYSTSEAFATTVVNSFTSQENHTPTLTVAALKSDIDATIASVSDGSITLGTIQATMVSNLISYIAGGSHLAGGLSACVYGSGAVTDSGSNAGSLTTDITASQALGHIATFGSAIGSDDISVVIDNTGVTLDSYDTTNHSNVTFAKAILAIESKAGNNHAVTMHGGGASDSMATKLGTLNTNIGDPATVGTTNKTVVTAIGTGTLSTTAKTDLISAINEVKISLGTQPTLPPSWYGPWDFLGYNTYYFTGSGSPLLATVGGGAVSVVPVDGSSPKTTLVDGVNALEGKLGAIQTTTVHTTSGTDTTAGSKTAAQLISQLNTNLGNIGLLTTGSYNINVQGGTSNPVTAMDAIHLFQVVVGGTNVSAIGASLSDAIGSTSVANAVLGRATTPAHLSDGLAQAQSGLGNTIVYNISGGHGHASYGVSDVVGQVFDATANSGAGLGLLGGTSLKTVATSIGTNSIANIGSDGSLSGAIGTNSGLLGTTGTTISAAIGTTSAATAVLERAAPSNNLSAGLQDVQTAIGTTTTGLLNTAGTSISTAIGHNAITHIGDGTLSGAIGTNAGLLGLANKSISAAIGTTIVAKNSGGTADSSTSLSDVLGLVYDGTTVTTLGLLGSTTLKTVATSIGTNSIAHIGSDGSLSGAIGTNSGLLGTTGTTISAAIGTTSAATAVLERAAPSNNLSAGLQDVQTAIGTTTTGLLNTAGTSISTAIGHNAITHIGDGTLSGAIGTNAGLLGLANKSISAAIGTTIVAKNSVGTADTSTSLSDVLGLIYDASANAGAGLGLLGSTTLNTVATAIGTTAIPATVGGGTGNGGTLSAVIGNIFGGSAANSANGTGSGYMDGGFLVSKSVGASAITDGSITGGLAGGGVKIAANTITSDNLHVNAVTDAKQGMAKWNFYTPDSGVTQYGLPTGAAFTSWSGGVLTFSTPITGCAATGGLSANGTKYYFSQATEPTTTTTYASMYDIAGLAGQCVSACTTQAGYEACMGMLTFA